MAEAAAALVMMMMKKKNRVDSTQASGNRARVVGDSGLRLLKETERPPWVGGNSALVASVGALALARVARDGEGQLRACLLVCWFV